MLPCSDEFKTRMEAPVRPSLDVEVIYSQIDVNATNTSVVSSTADVCYYSKIKQTLNAKTKKESVKIGTLEQNEFLLDGSYSYSPEAPLADDIHIGYRPLPIGNMTGAMDVSYVLTPLPNDYINSNGLTIFFSEALNQYPIDFNITLEKGGTTEIFTIRGNTSPIWEHENGYIYLPQRTLFEIRYVTKIKITILKWSKPYTRAKITQVKLGVDIVFDGSNLNSLEISNKFNGLSTQLSESTCDFSWFDVKKEFNPFAPVLSKYGVFSTGKQPVRVYAGYKDINEMKLLGYYELDSKPIFKDNQIYMSGSSLIVRLDKEMSGYFCASDNLYNIAARVLDWCGITNYLIDDTLKQTVVTNVIVKGNCKKIINDLCIAQTNCQFWYEDDKVRIGTRAIIDTGYIMPLELIKNVNINVSNNINELTVSSIENTLGNPEFITIGGEIGKEVTKVFKDDRVFTLTGATLISSTLNTIKFRKTASPCELKSAPIVSNPGNEFTRELNFNVKRDVVNINGNIFITSDELALKVRRWYGDNYAWRAGDGTKTQELEYRGNPIFELNDLIKIKTLYERDAELYINQIDYSFKDGGLMSKIIDDDTVAFIQPIGG